MEALSRKRIRKSEERPLKPRKGLFITTGTFTRDATREATRDGAQPIDLVDGDQLADKLKELGLGIKKEMVEKISVDTEWFKAI